MALLKLVMLGLTTPVVSQSGARSTLPYEADMLHCQPVGSSMECKGEESTTHFGIKSRIRWGIWGYPEKAI